MHRYSSEELTRFKRNFLGLLWTQQINAIIAQCVKLTEKVKLMITDCGHLLIPKLLFSKIIKEATTTKKLKTGKISLK